jgi:Rrf2 family protein
MATCHRNDMMMQLNMTTDYGIRTVLYLAQKNCVANSREICDVMKIPYTYMHKVTYALKHAGLIQEIRGVAGGFVLKKDPADISILNIVNVFEKTMSLNRCLEDDKFCSRNAAAYCDVRALYTEIQTEVCSRLDKKVATFLKP